MRVAAEEWFRLGGLSFNWDVSKSQSNAWKHGISFEEAATTWTDANAIERHDVEHSEEEERWLRIGMSSRDAVLVIWFSVRVDGEEETVRIIGARKATRSERRLYENEGR